MLTLRSAILTRGVSTAAMFTVVSFLGGAVAVHAQSNGNGLKIQLPPVQVSAQKETEDTSRVPVSVTTVTGETIDEAGLETVSDAGFYAPNVHFTDFTARKLSNARFRGIGAS